MQDIWDGIAHAEHAATEAEQTNKRIMRILTVAERQHGLSNALTALIGQQSGSSWDRVADGLCEIIGSAMLALSTITNHPEHTLGRYLGTQETVPHAPSAGGPPITSGEQLRDALRTEELATIAREKSADQRRPPRRTVHVGTLADMAAGPNRAVTHPEAHATDGGSL